MIEIRLLGELVVLRDGTPLPLPASKKSRALLGYLAATQRAHLRQKLCELLWDGPDDPRAALRWSLTKLRSVIGDRLSGSRDRVELQLDGMSIDVLQLCEPRAATTDRLEELAALFRGELLENLDLPGCFRYQQWCAGERERLRQAHAAILSELTQRLSGTDGAIQHARRHVAIDPFNDQAHATVIRLLAASGQTADALRHYEHCRQLFERELGTRPGAAVEEARRAVSRTGTAVPAALPPPLRQTAEAPFIGRETELARIASATGVVLIVGEPGIGKSRLLDEIRSRTNAPTLYGRAFAAEMIRPYGMWMEALPDFPAESDRPRLFEGVIEALRGTALVAFDDLQWIDEASAALLHYAGRCAGAARFVCTARSGELDDNSHALRLVQALQRDRLLTRIELGSLSIAETRALVASAEDPEGVARRSGGNPLFAIELARSGSTAGTGALTSIIAERLSALDGPARELVSWAAAIGRAFDVEVVGRATGMPSGEMLGALDKLERLSIIRPAGERLYDFTHDLVRDAAYQMITGPRRTLVHRHIARALSESHDSTGALAGDIVHHACLAGEHELAANAAVEAGKHCLRLFAYSEAISVARRGLQILESVPATKRLEIEMRLMNVIVMSRTPVRERIAWVSRIAELIEEARRAGLARTAGLGAHLVAMLRYEMDDHGEAAESTIRSAEISRSADPATAAIAMATTARCLLSLQREVPRAEELLLQAQAIGVPNYELSLGLGMLHAHHGRVAEATRYLEEALEIASRNGDHWREWATLARLVTLALEEHDAFLALRLCQRLKPVAERMTGGSEGARTLALDTLARYAAGEDLDVDDAVRLLREIDSKSDLAWSLNFLAEIELRSGRREPARNRAEEALAAAEAVGRTSEIAIARSILGQPVKPSPDLTARARRFLKERSHGRSRPGTDLRNARHA